MSHIILTSKEMTTAEAVLRDVSTWAIGVSMIVPGYLLQSEAMQWTGAVVFFLTIFTKAMGESKKLTIAQARAELDRLEAEANA